MSCHKPRLPCRVCVHVFRFPVIVPRVGVRTRVAKGACVGLSVSSSVVCALVSGCQAGIRVSGGVGVVVCGVSGGMGTAPAGFGSCRGRRVTCWCGGVLLSHILSNAVPSPCQVFASGFGMGPGVSPGPWPPQICDCHPVRLAYGGLWGGLGTGWWTRLKDSWCDARGVSPSSE